MDGLEIRGIELLTEEEKWELNKEIEVYKEKLRWKTKSDFVLKLVIKVYSSNKGDVKDMRKKYSLQAQIKGETHTFEASAVDWDFHKVMHKIFTKLITEVEHMYHSSEQRGSGQGKH